MSERTPNQELADEMDCELHRLMRRAELHADVKGQRLYSHRQQWDAVARALDLARSRTRRMMHEDDVRATT